MEWMDACTNEYISYKVLRNRSTIAVVSLRYIAMQNITSNLNIYINSDFFF